MFRFQRWRSLRQISEESTNFHARDRHFQPIASIFTKGGGFNGSTQHTVQTSLLAFGIARFFVDAR
jgi:hypothetical protein